MVGLHGPVAGEPRQQGEHVGAVGVVQPPLGEGAEQLQGEVTGNDGPRVVVEHGGEQLAAGLRGGEERRGIEVGPEHGVGVPRGVEVVGQSALPVAVGAHDQADQGRDPAQRRDWVRCWSSGASLASLAIWRARDVGHLSLSSHRGPQRQSAHAALEGRHIEVGAPVDESHQGHVGRQRAAQRSDAGGKGPEEGVAHRRPGHRRDRVGIPLDEHLAAPRHAQQVRRQRGDRPGLHHPDLPAVAGPFQVHRYSGGLLDLLA